MESRHCEMPVPAPARGFLQGRHTGVLLALCSGRQGHLRACVLGSRRSVALRAPVPVLHVAWLCWLRARVGTQTLFCPRTC